MVFACGKSRDPGLALSGELRQDWLGDPPPPGTLVASVKEAGDPELLKMRMARKEAK
jgi:hypothetical protein